MRALGLSDPSSYIFKSYITCELIIFVRFDMLVSSTGVNASFQLDSYSLLGASSVTRGGANSNFFSCNLVSANRFVYLFLNYLAV